MKRPIRGIVHVHSHYSYDGKHPLSEIADAAQNLDLDFVCMTEHSDTLDLEKVDRLVEECRSVSSAKFLMIPGIEFTCDDNLHLLGIGVRKYTASKDPMYVNKFIRNIGALSVIAHPLRKNYLRLPEILPFVSGIEVWNCVYDGRFFPNARALDLYTEAKRSNPGLIAFSGRDLHRLANIRDPFLQIQSCEVKEKDILNKLSSGEFIGKSFWSSVSALPRWGRFGRSRFYLQQVAYFWLKRTRDVMLHLKSPDND